MTIWIIILYDANAYKDKHKLHTTILIGNALWKLWFHSCPCCRMVGPLLGYLWWWTFNAKGSIFAPPEGTILHGTCRITKIIFTIHMSEVFIWCIILLLLYGLECSQPSQNSKIFLTQMSTAIPHWKHQFSSDHWSQAMSGSVSTWMGDRLGIPGAVDIIFLYAHVQIFKKKCLKPFGKICTSSKCLSMTFFTMSLPSNLRDLIFKN